MGSLPKRKDKFVLARRSGETPMMPYWGKLPGAHCTSLLELPAPFPLADLKNPLQQLNIMLNPGPVHGQSLQNQNLSRKYITTADSKNRVAWRVDQEGSSSCLLLLEELDSVSESQELPPSCPCKAFASAEPFHEPPSWHVP